MTKISVFSIPRSSRMKGTKVRAAARMAPSMNPTTLRILKPVVVLSSRPSTVSRFRLYRLCPADFDAALDEHGSEKRRQSLRCR